MAVIEGGTMTVGRTAAEVAAQCREIGPTCDRVLMDWQTPSSTATVVPFSIDVNEVTNEQLALVLDHAHATLYTKEDENTHALRYVVETSAVAKDPEILVDLHPQAGGIERTEDPNHRYRARAGRERLPAVQVTWFGARFYCEAVGKRLPTEDEWEAAARGPDNRTYPWGEAVPRCGQVAIPRDGQVPMAGDCPHTEDIDLLVAGASEQDVTQQGVHDLGGSVGEWTASAFSPSGRGDSPHACFAAARSVTRSAPGRPSATGGHPARRP
jgi:formylglycine-generating enzyme required for sulfatase activity